MPRRALVAGLGCVALATLVSAAAGRVATADIDADFAAFWAAATPSAAARAAGTLVADGVSFDAAWARLKDGRPYAAAPTGTIDMPIRIGGIDPFPNTIDVPENYDPSRRWPVRVQLHGGIGREESSPQRGPNRIAGEPQIYVFPSARADAAWWHHDQVENIGTLLDRVKRAYNVDESRIYLTGVSDGGTGTYFLAMRDATPWAACLPLIGDPGVLLNESADTDGQLYPTNAAACPFFIVNAEHDPLYPAGVIAPMIGMFTRAGVKLEFHRQPTGGHDVSWWPAIRAPYEAFVHAHPRNPYPDRLSWETERTDRYNRVDWLVIDELGTTSSDVPLLDENMDDEGKEMYPRSEPSGRVDLERYGNAIKAFARGVRRFTLLLSPDVFDFKKPITVTVNGNTAFSGVVKKDPAVLLKWAARDNDRTMLFGAELSVKVVDR